MDLFGRKELALRAEETDCRGIRDCPMSLHDFIRALPGDLYWDGFGGGCGAEVV